MQTTILFEQFDVCTTSNFESFSKQNEYNKWGLEIVYITCHTYNDKRTEYCI